MFFLLPPKPISDPIVTNFRQVLSQSNETNYHSIPLYNLRGAQKESESSMQTEPRNEPKLVSKSGNMPRKSNVATKSKPHTTGVTSSAAIPSKCRNCNWIFPESMTNEDRDLHAARCRNGYGEEDQMVWIRCKGDRSDYRENINAVYNWNRKKFDEFLKDKEKPEKAGKAERMEREKSEPARPVESGKKKMEVEENFISDKKIKKKPNAIKETKEKKPETAETKKRKAGVQSQRDAESSDEDLMVREDLKKIKKNSGEGANSKSSEVDTLSGKVRKSGANKVSLPMASGLVFDPTQAFNKFSGEKR